MTSNNLARFLIVVTCITGCCCIISIQPNSSAVSTSKNNTISEFINHIEAIAAQEETLSSNETQTKKAVPNDCSQREKMTQPVNDKNSRIQKCCPHGESLSMFKQNQSDELCTSSSLNFNPTVINAMLYDNCIEDMETDIKLPIEIGNPCNTSLLYNDEDDIFFVLQDGSLLLMDKFANESYTVERKYCLDIDNVSGTTYAVVCITSVEEHLKRGQIVAVTILMIISIPCLLLVSYLHIAIRELRNVHGLSLSVMSFCLAVGLTFHALVHIFSMDTTQIGYAVQYFILAYFFWFLCLCCNVLLNIWYKIPKNKRYTRLIGFCNFLVYFGVSHLCPLILVILTVKKGLQGMPSYFIQGLTASIRESQRYFIPPVSSVLFLSFILLAISFFGFQRIKRRDVSTTTPRNNALYSNIYIDEERYEEVKKDAKCISLLGLIMIISWMLEIVTFYSPGPQSYLTIMEMINGLQGVFISLIFLVVRRRRTLILRWWYDRGSHKVENVELTEITK